MLAVVCLELMAYVMPRNSFASRAKLLRFSILQPLMDELIAVQKNSYILCSSSTCQHGQAMLALL